MAKVFLLKHVILLSVIVAFGLMRAVTSIEVSSFFVYSPELKTSQCGKLIDILKLCNLTDHYNEIPPILQTFTRVPEIEIYFQVRIYTIHPNVTDKGSPNGFPTFCNRGFCLECLIKDGEECYSTNRTPSDQSYGDRYRDCIMNLTQLQGSDDDIGNAFCISGSCGNIETTSQCAKHGMGHEKDCDPFCKCRKYGHKGKHCYYVKPTTRTRLYENGNIYELHSESSRSNFHWGLRLIVLVLSSIILYK